MTAALHGRVRADQRYTHARRCPVCGGSERDPRGAERRCFGFRSDDGYAHCSREEHAGTLPRSATSETYAHRLAGSCRCGKEHGDAPPVTMGTGRRRRRSQDERIVATYDYRDEAGGLLYQAVRYEPKRFSQRRPGPRDGDWIWDLENTRRVLYRLDRVLAAEPSAVIYIVEGEKDVEAIERLGLVATCNPQGAKKWGVVAACASTALRGRRVVVVADDDEPGRAHAADVERRLAGIAADVRVIELPCHDAADWIAAGGTRAEFEAIANAARARDDAGTSGDERAARPGAPQMWRLDEVGNGKRLAHMFGDELKYVADRDQWFAWDGTRWKPDRMEVERKAKLVASELYKEAAAFSQRAAQSDDGQSFAEAAKLRLKWAKTTSSAMGLRSMLEVAQSELPLAVAGDAFDREAFAFNVMNGTIDLRTGELGRHRPEQLITKLAPVTYAPEARAPSWERFLARVLPDAEVRAWLQRYVGYSLTGDVREQVLLFAYGGGANGKSVLLDVLLGIIGDYGQRSDPELLLAKQGEVHQTGTADLEGKRLVVASEIEHNRAWAEAAIKRITGDSTITARRMRTDFYTFSATHKLWIAANTKPKVHGTDNGIWRRMKLVPFEVTIPPEDQGRGLVAKLLATEAPGILAWAVRGCLEWQARGLAEPATIARATEVYRADQDVLGHWLNEECTVAAGLWSATSDLYDSYKAWCVRAGRHPLVRDSLRDRLLERPGIEEHCKTTGRGLRGIGIGLPRSMAVQALAMTRDGRMTDDAR